MSGKLSIPADTVRAQQLAARPDVSAWVSAHAGSGKTHVLSQRVVRLLLDGCEPSKVLCLTYTRAAAANMANRVFGDLAAWALMEDAPLAQVVGNLTGNAPGPKQLAAARRLFARALETPGGLKIQTIHAFCEAVLQQFPLEANIAGHFEMLDSRQEDILLAEARRDMIAGADTGHDPALARAFPDILATAGEFGLDALMGEIVRHRDGLRRFIAEVRDEDGGFSVLRTEFGFALDDTAESVAAAVWPLPQFDSAYLRRFAEEAQLSGAAAVVNDMLPEMSAAFAESSAERRLDHLVKGFLKATDGQPYAASRFKKALRIEMPDLSDRYMETARHIIAARDRLALFRMVEATGSALTIADWLIARYERIKSARGFLDFNDLIGRTSALLARADAGAWVQYKLDQGIDHILIDEAQDTSPEQWRVVKSLAAEFFAGRGARDHVRRTIFAVGDEKQSIYSFQGAEPAAFAESGHQFASSVAEAEARFEQVRLTRSFRSTDDVLQAVDLVFADEIRRKGLTRDPGLIAHDGIRTGEPGYVEAWPSLGPETVEEPDDWTQPVDHASAPSVRLAESIADTISGWLREGEILEGQKRRVAPGDILVLVRKRGSFVHALTRALKDASRAVPVAGADRLVLTDHIAVKDLLAIARFVQQPEDDLSLAALLRSPIFGLSDSELFALAHDRGNRSLYSSLRHHAEADLLLANVAGTLETWRDSAAFLPVFEFYAGLLAGAPGTPAVRAKLVARLGAEAGDVIDEFLSFCLAIEQTGGDGLEALLAALDESAPEIKREMDQSRDEVRIMTVHASKGLEAPIVFLVDPGSEAFHTQHLPVLMPFRSRNGRWKGEGYLWRAGPGAANPFAKGRGTAIRDAAEEEYRRLLYVGMTRAEDRLIVCGYHGVRGRPALSWHGMVEAALKGSDYTETRERQGSDAPVLRFRYTPFDGTDATVGNIPVVEPPAVAAAPDPLGPLPAAPKLPPPLRPSGTGLMVEDGNAEPAGTGASPVLDPVREPSLAQARGIAIHRLLQLLPSVPEKERPAALARYLSSVASAWPQAERDRLAESVGAILSDPAFADVFAPGSRAEVSLMGEIEVGGRSWSVSGKVDRLAVSENEVLIVDYKTGRVVPRNAAEVPENHVRQLAVYRALLEPVYPGRTVRAALLFTEGPIFIPLEPQALDAALAALTTP
ncbi:double-strand break repair helicase AddA [Mesorhizobium sp. Z1-4]|uniref:double-strand break repair helicase AddA n=1 Tax=Mesorhizobium sp. Z1-4 TaxID=2448478 RepID=UPI000FDCBE15|nr:double-strand break repair helicase AddA [Mesorhizobium sp. Z1-4]